LALKEVDFLAELSSIKNPHLISYHGHTVDRQDANTHIFWILIELGTKGTLWDLLAKKLEKKDTFSEKMILDIGKKLANSLLYVHERGYIHCDFKVENILVFENEEYKLCDFGSINTFDIDFKKIDPEKMYKYEEIFEKQTTLMYRPPEMCDPYLGYKVNSKVDIWMLGCVLFTLMFFKHPFAESSKLSITSASYRYPVDNEYSADLEILVRNLLTPDPDIRPDASQVIAWIEKLQWKKTNSADEMTQILELNEMAFKISQEHNAKHLVMKTGKYRKHSPDIAARNRRENKLQITKNNTNTNVFDEFDKNIRASNPQRKKKTGIENNYRVEF
jgi:AP2-associated kinase